MNVRDINISVSSSGYFLTIIPIGDEHFCADTHARGAISLLRRAVAEARRLFRAPLGFLKLGDELEYDRKSFTEKLFTIGKDHDRAGHEKMAKELVRKIMYHYNGMFKKGDLKLAAVAGNHKVRFTIGHKDLADMRDGLVPPLNSTHMLAERLGFPYMGDGHCRITLHVNQCNHRKVYKILILHGEGAGTSVKADMTEFQRIRAMYGELDLIIKAHSHKPMTTHWGRFDTGASERIDGVRVEETTLINIGSMRQSMCLGATDYGERHQYQPIPVRFPFIALKVVQHNNRGFGPDFEIRAVPITF